MNIVYNQKNRYVRITPKNKLMVKVLKSVLKGLGFTNINKYGAYESDSSVYINNVKMS